jgi:hypothetical protein
MLTRRGMSDSFPMQSVTVVADFFQLLQDCKDCCSALNAPTGKSNAMKEVKSQFARVHEARERQSLRGCFGSEHSLRWGVLKQDSVTLGASGMIHFPARWQIQVGCDNTEVLPVLEHRDAHRYFAGSTKALVAKLET